MQWIEGAPAPPHLIVPTGDLWVFGYGSLMWNPGFPHDAVEPAILDGWHRSFCIQSALHRGTPEWPGLVVGLSPGGRCRGLALRAQARHKGSSLEYLWQREMALADGYLPRTVTALLDDGRRIDALTFVANPVHEAYAGDLPFDEAALRIATARGQRGSNREYLDRTIEHLGELGIEDPGLALLARAVAAVA
jgi:cation transport protein ChaC